jgi:hypothetical protein
MCLHINLFQSHQKQSCDIIQKSRGGHILNNRWSKTTELYRTSSNVILSTSKKIALSSYSSILRDIANAPSDDVYHIIELYYMLSSSLDFGRSSFGFQGSQTMRDPEHHRALRGGDVEIENASKNTCRWMNCLNTTYEGNRVASGVMFSVTAKQTLEILSLEIDHYTFDGDLEVEIFTRPGADYIDVFSDPAEWNMVAQTPIFRAPEGTGSIVPRSAFTSIQMAAGEILSFYVTLRTQHLKLSATSEWEDVTSKNFLTTGDAYVSDDFLQVDVGIALRTFKFPETSLDFDAAFGGAFHYQAVQSCTALTPTIFLMVLKFAVEHGVNVRSSDFSNAFVDIFSAEPQLVEFTKLHGLQIDQLQATDVGVSGVCGNLIVSETCRSYELSLYLRHYPTLSPKEVELGIYTALSSGQESQFRLESGFDVIYVGDKALVENFEIILTGLPQQTILSPIHRRYIEDVTFAFLERFAPVEPYQVEVSGQMIFDQRNLRRMGTYDRESQSTGIVKVEALIYGVGDDATTFFEAIEDTFTQNRDQYRLDLSKEQLRPSDINEFDDLGYTIFADLFSTSVSLRATTRAGSFSEALDGGGLSKEEIQIIVFSVVLGMSGIWLIYRIAIDFFFVKSSDRITQVKKLSEKKKKEKELEKAAEEKQGDEKEICRLVDDSKSPPKPMLSLPRRAMNRSSSWTVPARVSPMMEPTDKSNQHHDAPHRPIKRSSSWPHSVQQFEAPTTETKAENGSGEKGRGVARNQTIPLLRDHARPALGDNARNNRDNRDVDELSSSHAQLPGSEINRSGDTGGAVPKDQTMPLPRDHVKLTSEDSDTNNGGINGFASPRRTMKKATPAASTMPASLPFPPQNRSGQNGRGAGRNQTMPLPSDHVRSSSPFPPKNRSDQNGRGAGRNQTMPLPSDHVRSTSPFPPKNRSGQNGRGAGRNQTTPLRSDHVRSTSGKRSPNDRGTVGLVSPRRAMRKPTPEASTPPGSPPFSPHNRSGQNGRGVTRNHTKPLPRDHARPTPGEKSPIPRDDRAVNEFSSPAGQPRRAANKSSSSDGTEAFVSPSSPPFLSPNRSGKNGRGVVRNRTTPLPRDPAKPAPGGISPKNRGNRGIDGLNSPFTERPRVVGGVNMAGERFSPKQSTMRKPSRSSKESTRPGPPLGPSIPETRAAPASLGVLQRIDTVGISQNNGNIKKKTKNMAPPPESPGTSTRKKQSKSSSNILPIPPESPGRQSPGMSSTKKKKSKSSKSIPIPSESPGGQSVGRGGKTKKPKKQRPEGSDLEVAKQSPSTT